MPSVKEQFEALKIEIAKGNGEERCTPAILVRKAAADRVKNKGPRPKTIFRFETNSPIAYSDLNKYKDRVLHWAGNKSIGIEILIRAWRELTPTVVKKWAEDGYKDSPFQP